MPIRKKRTEPKIDTVCQRKYKGKICTMTVVKKKDGKIGYRVNQKTFATPSAAAKSITKTEINGWVFWGLDKNRVS